MILYIVHIQSKYNEQEYNCSDPFDNILDAHAWGAMECYDQRDVYYRIEKVTT